MAYVERKPGAKTLTMQAHIFIAIAYTEVEYKGNGGFLVFKPSSDEWTFIPYRGKSVPVNPNDCKVIGDVHFL